jgi:hypothetical protein
MLGIVVKIPASNPKEKEELVGIFSQFLRV